MVEFSVDVLLSILDHIHHKKDLAALCLVNATFSKYTETLLYHTITITKFNRTPAWETLATSRRLALKVHRFNVGECDWPQINATDKTRLERALRHMKNLRVLELHVRPPLRLGYILEACEFKLQSLTCGFLCDVHLAAFFKQQPELKDITFLSWHPPHHPCFIDTTCVPSLSALSGDATWINLLAPSRPINHVAARNVIRGETLSRALSLSSEPVERLDLVIDFERETPPVIRTALPSLIHLKLPCLPPRTLRGSDTTNLSGFAFWLKSLLPAFPSLESIAIQTGRALLDHVDHVEFFELFVTRTAESAGPTLSRFIFTFDLGTPAGSSPMVIIWHREAHEGWRIVKNLNYGS